MRTDRDRQAKENAMKELETFSRHVTTLHIQFAIIIMLTVAVSLLLDHFSPRLPAWERGVLTATARLLLLCEVIGFSLLLAVSTVEQLAGYRHMFG
jgi:mannose/fructose/N-acetylgalactosamine-specific phosphotransferase system component IIC